MAETKKTKVLVIDDDPVLLEVMRTNLEMEGYDVITEASGAAGLATAIVDQPDVIILDILIPDMDGWEICRKLRAEPKTKYIPTIMLTALNETHNVVRGFECGADDYLAKPFEVAELFARLDSLLRKANKGLAIDPLTKLPGKHQIYEETRRRIEMRGSFFAFAYVDITNLRTINYTFGIERGDQVIHNLGNILRDLMKPEEEFLGYMGEDDFVIITTPLRIPQIFEKLKSRFEENLREICPEIAGTAGGERVKISMGVVTNEEKQFGDPLQVKNTALEVLKNARNETDHFCANLKDYPI